MFVFMDCPVECEVYGCFGYYWSLENLKVDCQVVGEAQSFEWRDEAIVASYLSIHHGGNSLKKTCL
jgi:hypothetical protein